MLPPLLVRSSEITAEQSAELEPLQAQAGKIELLVSRDRPFEEFTVDGTDLSAFEIPPRYGRGTTYPRGILTGSVLLTAPVTAMAVSS